jgi:hypothetical protein
MNENIRKTKEWTKYRALVLSHNYQYTYCFSINDLWGLLIIFQRYGKPQGFSIIYGFSCFLVHLNQHDLYTMTP